MRIKRKKVRKFSVNKKIDLKDAGKIYLESNEQVTFIHNKKQEYDLCKKE